MCVGGWVINVVSKSPWKFKGNNNKEKKKKKKKQDKPCNNKGYMAKCCLVSYSYQHCV